MSVWREVGVADNIIDAADIRCAAQEAYPGKSVRIREQRTRADIDG